MSDDRGWNQKPKYTTYHEYATKLFAERAERDEEWDTFMKLQGPEEAERILSGKVWDPIQGVVLKLKK